MSLPLLPASRPSSVYGPIPSAYTYGLLKWTFGRGSVLWRIWPAVLFHTLFAAVIVYLSVERIFDLEIPSVMLTILGVVIGFVISYRAISGYDRYWMGKTAWGDVIRNARTLSRLIWFHVPLRLTPKTPEETSSGKVNRPLSELKKVMAEKRMAMDLIEGFAVAVKHHLRGEIGIYYEDLYQLIRPMHDHSHTADDDTTTVITSAIRQPRKAQRITTHVVDESASQPTAADGPASPQVDPLINAYGTFSTGGKRSPSRVSHASDVSDQSQGRLLLPSPTKPTESPHVARDLIPFANLSTALMKKVGFMRSESPVPNVTIDPYSPEVVRHKWKGPISSGLKYRPAVAGGGENLPLEILRCLSEWLSVLEDRTTVPGTSIGFMIATLGAFEESLNALERILTTPLPFVYAVHIRHTVWMYLFFLPFQLVTPFGYSTIPGVAIAAFIYLGFLAAGEEMEQPFGYDDNDLDLDLFCQLVVHEDIHATKTSPCLHAYFGPDSNHAQSPPRRAHTLSEMTAREERHGDHLSPH